MKVVILAGGLGTRIAEESDLKPKPMVEIGGRPLLWHIMKIYSSFGFNDFVICLGYKGYVIKEFFYNYYYHMSNMKINLENGSNEIIDSHAENWKITLVDTGSETMTGGRIKRILPYLDNETFFLTYGDGLSNINIEAELAFHRSRNKLVTVAAVQPPGRFGVLDIDDEQNVRHFQEKPTDEIGWINGGFFIVEPQALDYIDDDKTSWEKEPLSRISSAGQLQAFYHQDFWQPCDTLRDKRVLEEMWNTNLAPWKIWQ